MVGLARFFASDLRAVVFSVDYRLAPEFKLPTIHEDCYEALNWVIKRARFYRADASRVALWGCSAGGHLAATVAMRDAFEHTESRICWVSLVVPATCHDTKFMGTYTKSRSIRSKYTDPLGPHGAELTEGIQRLRK